MYLGGLSIVANKWFKDLGHMLKFLLYKLRIIVEKCFNDYEITFINSSAIAIKDILS